MKKLNPIALLGFLGLIGLVGIITGRTLWYSWFAWFAWFARYNTPTDERFYRNIEKSGLICFFIAIAGLGAGVILIGLGSPQTVVFSVVGGLFALLLIVFTFLFQVFENQGA